MPATYDEVMLDWAVAEVLSPGKWPRYAAAVGDELRARCAGDFGKLTASDRAILIEAVEQVRGPDLLRPYHVDRSWTFQLEEVSAERLAKFGITTQFQHQYGAIFFGGFASRIKNNPLKDEVGMQAEAMEMLRRPPNGGKLHGYPIALIVRPGATPLLIEGYRRAMVALWSGAASIELFIGSHEDESVKPDPIVHMVVSGTRSAAPEEVSRWAVAAMTEDQARRLVSAEHPDLHIGCVDRTDAPADGSPRVLGEIGRGWDDPHQG